VTFGLSPIVAGVAVLRLVSEATIEA